MTGNVPSRWPAARLGDHATVKARLGWKGLKAEEYVDDGPIFLSAPNLRGGRIDFYHVDHLPEWRYEESPEIQLAVGDVLLVKDGSTLGMSGIVKALPAPATVNGSIAVIRAGASLASGFLFYFINGQRFLKLIWVNRSGLGVPHLFQADLREFQISLPALSEQRRIAEILCTLDETIEQTEALIAKYQQIKAGLMHDLFTRGVTPEGCLRPTSAEVPQLYKESPLGSIPKEWDVASVGSCLLGIDAGKSPDCPDTPASGDQWGVLKVGAVDQSGLRENENKTVAEDWLKNPSFLVRHNDLLLSRANTFDLVGLVCHVTSSPHNLMLSDKTLRLKPNLSRIAARFLFWVLQSSTARRQIENSATGTSGSMKNVSQGSVRAIKMVCPPVAEQNRITSHLDSLEELLATMRSDLTKLRQLKLGLMQDLLTRRVSVPLADAAA
jgi:type I restriction enzyme S subunit